jgi:hypothetical protein
MPTDLLLIETVGIDIDRGHHTKTDQMEGIARPIRRIQRWKKMG